MPTVRAEKPLFDSVNQALTVHHHFIIRLSSLIAWTIFGLAHLLFVVAVLAFFWWSQLTPGQIANWVDQISKSTPAAWFSALGGSVMGLVTFYWWLIRKMHRAAGGPLFDYLLKGL